MPPKLASSVVPVIVRQVALVLQPAPALPVPTPLAAQKYQPLAVVGRMCATSRLNVPAASYSLIVSRGRCERES